MTKQEEHFLLPGNFRFLERIARHHGDVWKYRVRADHRKISAEFRSHGEHPV